VAATIADIRAGLKTRLTAAYPTGWNIQAYVQSNPTGPSMYVMPMKGVYDRAMQGAIYDQLWFAIRAFVPATTDFGMQKKLDGLMDSSSTTAMKNAIEADITLGGKVSWAVLRNWGNYDLYASSGALSSLGVEFQVEVYT
jgi:hypothetical protein